MLASFEKWVWDLRAGREEALDDLRSAVMDPEGSPLLYLIELGCGMEPRDTLDLIMRRAGID